VVTSINSGRPVVSAAPKSRIAKNLRQLADALPGGARSATEADASRAGALLRLVWNPKRIPGVG
jgi:MinD-like ATPase involved in chromosome partitioning or flagellar assembly